jgi:hypothetical protein
VGEGMSDQKDDLNQPSVEQGNEDPASGLDEQLGSEEALQQPKEEEKDLGVDSKWLPEEGEEKGLEPKSTTTDLSENGEEDVQVATGDQELKVLPDNEDEEKEEILLADTKTIRSKKQPSKTSQQKNEMEEQTILLTSVSKQLEKQNTQINKILQMLQSVVKQVKSAERQLELVKQIQLQIKQVQKQASQIQKELIKKNKKKMKR